MPNLADRDRFALSNDGALLQGMNVGLNVFAPETPTQRFSIFERALHVYGRRIGSVRETSRPFPYRGDFKYCVEFGLNLIRVLRQTPARHYGTNQTPMESLAATLALDRAPSSRSFARRNPTTSDLERFLTSAMEARIWLEVAYGNKSATVDEVLSQEPLFRDLQLVHGVSATKLSAAVARWRSPQRILAWHSPDEDTRIVDGAMALMESCKELISAYGQAKGQRIVSVQMDEIWPRETDGDGPRRREHHERLMGMASDAVEDGDEVWAIQGSEWPFVLRRYTDEDDGNPVTTTDAETKSQRWSWHRKATQVPVYQFLGEAYVHGVMHGQLYQHSEFDAERDTDELILR